MGPAPSLSRLPRDAQTSASSSTRSSPSSTSLSAPFPSLMKVGPRLFTFRQTLLIPSPLRPRRTEKVHLLPHPPQRLPRQLGHRAGATIPTDAKSDGSRRGQSPHVRRAESTVRRGTGRRERERAEYGRRGSWRGLQMRDHVKGSRGHIRWGRSWRRARCRTASPIRYRSGPGNRSDTLARTADRATITKYSFPTCRDEIVCVQAGISISCSLACLSDMGCTRCSPGSFNYGPRDRSRTLHPLLGFELAFQSVPPRRSVRGSAQHPTRPTRGTP